MKLEPRVMNLLLYLAARSGKVVTREELERAVWSGTVVSYDALTGAIQKLRRALGDDPRKPRFIETLPKKGYMLSAPVILETDSIPIDSTLPETKRTHVKSKRMNPWGLSFVLLVLVSLAVMLVLRVNDSKIQTQPPVVVSEQGSIAVLPFVNLNGNPEWDYFSDGITDDLIVGLARFSEFLVISRDSTFVYKNSDLDTQSIGENLNAKYIVQGSVSRLNEQVRINAKLIETANINHLWAQTYTAASDSIFGLQDKLTQDVVQALFAHMNVNRNQELGPPATENPKAYDNYLYGRQSFFQYASKAENLTARRFFEKAIHHDPNFALAYSMLAWTHAFDAMNGWSDDRNDSLVRAQALADKALSLKKSLPVAYFVKGLSYRERGDYVKALVEAEKAIEYEPNYANAHVLLATLLYYAGRPEEGLERIKKAIMLNPHHPYNYTFHLGQAYFVLDRYDEAIRVFRQGLESNPSAERLHLWLAAALAHTGDLEEAEWEADQVLTLNPDFSLNRIKETFPFKDPEDLDRLLEGLEKAGLINDSE